MRTVPERVTGSSLVLAAAVLFGTTGTAQHFAPDGAPATTVGWARMAVGAAALVALALLFRRRPTVRKAVLLPAAAMAAYQPFFFAGVGRTGVAVGTIVAIGSAPVFAGAFGRAVRREPVTLRWVAATLLAVLGAGFLLSGGDAGTVDTGGVLLALGAGLSYAVFAIGAKELLETDDPLAAMASIFAVAAVLLTPYAAIDDVSWLASGRGSAVALHLGLVATAAAYVLYSTGLRRIEVGEAATLTLAEPLTAALLGVVVVDETLRSSAWAGVLLLVAGLALLTIRRRPPAPTPI